jgi:two-component system sensor histidine kinase/response regulator
MDVLPGGTMTNDPPSRTGYRVLVADDDAPNRMIAVLMLEERGHEVSLVGDGWDALAALARQHFDIVLMDVRLPHLDGYEATKLIRDREKLTGERVPIIAITAQDRTIDEQRCLAVGMDGHNFKPVQMGELLSTIESALGISSEGASSMLM